MGDLFLTVGERAVPATYLGRAEDAVVTGVTSPRARAFTMLATGPTMVSDQRQWAVRD